MTTTELSGDTKPQLPRGVRLRHDEIRNEWMLLAPERVLKLDSIAAEVLRRCTGEATFDTIVSDLAATFAADPSRIAADVRTMLLELAEKRVLDL